MGVIPSLPQVYPLPKRRHIIRQKVVYAPTANTNTNTNTKRPLLIKISELIAVKFNGTLDSKIRAEIFD